MTGLGPVLVIGASGAIGKAIADAIDEENPGKPAIRLSRSGPKHVPIDISDEASIASAAAAIEASGTAPRTIIIATGLLHDDEQGPEKSLRELDQTWLSQQYAVNTIGPMLIAKHFLPLMAAEGETRFAVLSARVGSISDNRLGGWYGYRMAKAALNMGIKNLAIEWRRKNDRSIIVGLHPGTVDSSLSKPFHGNLAPGQLFDPERAALQLLDVLEELKPAQSGQIFAWDGSKIPA